MRSLFSIDVCFNSFDQEIVCVDSCITSFAVVASNDTAWSMDFKKIRNTLLSAILSEPTHVPSHGQRIKKTTSKENAA
jgi:hypothetical protein